MALNGGNLEKNSGASARFQTAGSTEVGPDSLG